MLHHSLDITANLHGRLCSKAVIFNDFQALLLKFKTKLHQKTTMFETLYHELLFKVKYFYTTLVTL